MKGVDPPFVQALGRLRLDVGRMIGSHGVGERRSRTRGEGIEFEDHRPYVPGDDLRRVDPYVYARLETPFVRQYNVSQSLEVTILIDCSASMEVGTPRKLDTARTVALGMAIVALSGLDSVSLGAWQGDHLSWRRGLSSIRQLNEAAAWLHDVGPGGRTDPEALVRLIRPHVRNDGLLVLISDLWFDDVASQMRRVLAMSSTTVVIHVLAEEELNPRLPIAAGVRIIDPETGDEHVVGGTADVIEEYREHLAKHITTIRDATVRVGGRYVRVNAADDIGALFLHVLRQEGIVR